MSSILTRLGFIFFLCILVLFYQNCTLGFESSSFSEDNFLSSDNDANEFSSSIVGAPVVASSRFNKLLSSDQSSINLSCLDPERERAPRLPSLLTKSEISNGLKEVLGIENKIDGYPELNGAGGYEQSNKIFIKDTYYAVISSIANNVAEQFITSVKKNSNRTWDCEVNVSCLSLITDKLAGYLWRRPLIASELSMIDQLAQSFESGEEKATEVLKFIISSPQFYTKNLTLKSGANGAQVNLWDYAASMAFILGDNFTPIDLYEAIKNGTISSQEQIFTYAKSYIERPEVQQNLVDNFLGIWLDYRYALDSTQKFDNEEVRSIASASSQMVGSILKNNEDLSQILQHSSGGILRSKLFARSTFGSEKDSDTVKRGRYVLERLLCFKMPDLTAATEEDISNVSSQAGFPVNGSNMDIIKFHSQQAKCAVCHNFIDPAAIGLENMGPFGNNRTIYPNGSEIKFPNTQFAGTSYSSQGEYIKLISETFDFKHCFSEKLHLKVNAMAANANTNSCFMSEIYQGKSDLGLNDLILNVLKTSLVSRVSKPDY